MRRKPYNSYDFDPDASFVPMQGCCSTPNVTVDVDIEEFKEALNSKLDETVKELTDSIDEKINETIEGITDGIEDKINESVECINNNIDDKLDSLSCQLSHAEHHIIHEVEEHALDDMCLCRFATKEDIKQAVETINENTKDITEKIIEEIDFKFENLNEQIKE